MKKIDARVRYTRKILKDSFLKLLKDKPVNKITVKSVCELAEINRATFYSHYSDCFDLLENIEQELLQQFQKSLKLMDSFDSVFLIEAIYKMVEQNQEACEVLIFRGASTSVLTRMIDLAKEQTIIHWKKELKKATEAEIEMLYMHLSNGLMNVVVDGYYKYTKEEVINFVDEIVSSSIKLFH